MDEAKTVSASTARQRGVWIAAAAVFGMGLLLLNVDTIGRIAIAAFDRWQAGHEPPVPMAAPLPGVAAVPAPAPAADAAMPARRLPAGRAAAPGRDATTTAPPPAATTAPPLAPLYPAPGTATAAAVPAPAGRAGLVALMRAGALRPASGNDLAYWKMRHASNNPMGTGQRFEDWARMMPAYVVVGEMAIPDGLSGANAVIFILGDRAPIPTGDPGHSVILDPASGGCIGTLCRMLLER